MASLEVRQKQLADATVKVNGVMVVVCVWMCVWIRVRILYIFCDIYVNIMWS